MPEPPIFLLTLVDLERLNLKSAKISFTELQNVAVLPVWSPSRQSPGYRCAGLLPWRAFHCCRALRRRWRKTVLVALRPVPKHSPSPTRLFCSTGTSRRRRTKDARHFADISEGYDRLLEGVSASDPVGFRGQFEARVTR
jgi:hypothetical protein